jgi:hypothetical protein
MSLAPFAPPEVVGPLSPCSTKVRVRNFLSKATVGVFVNGTQVSSKTSNGLMIGSNLIVLGQSIGQTELGGYGAVYLARRGEPNGL